MKQALLIGTTSTSNTTYFTTSMLDVEAMKVALGKNVDEEGFETITAYTENVTIDKVRNALKVFFNASTAVSLFYFSGHASSNGDGAIILSETNGPNELSFREILAFAQKSKATQTVIILDCCFAGSIGDILNDFAGIQMGVSIIASCRPNEFSVGSTGDLSVFTKYLVKALNGGAADEKGTICVMSVYKYLYAHIPHDIQNIVFKCNVQGLVVLRRVEKFSSLNIASDRIENAINELSNSGCIIKVVYDKKDYLSLLADNIRLAKSEIFFTSSRIREEEDGEYGDLQKAINVASKEFGIRNPHRIHLGIVPDSGNNQKGVLQLRFAVPDVVIKYNYLLETLKFNFFICDANKVIIRLKDHPAKVVYAVSIENSSFALEMKRIFTRLWSQSDSTFTVITKLREGLHGPEINSIGAKLWGNTTKFNTFLKDRIYPEDYKRRIIEVAGEKIIVARQALEELNDLSIKSDVLKRFYTYVRKIHSESTLVTLFNVQQLYHQMASRTQIDYEKLSGVFALQFFLANYFKMLHTLIDLHKIKPCITSEILDLGGGGAASSAAFFDFCLEKSLDPLNFTILDRSPEQLKIAKDLLIGNQVLYVQQNAIEFLEKEVNQFDLIISSNFLCEARKMSRHRLLRLISRRIKSDGLLLIVEQTESGVYDDVLASGLFEMVYYKFNNERYEIPDFSFSEIKKSVNLELEQFIKKNYTLRYGIYQLSKN